MPPTAKAKKQPPPRGGLTSKGHAYFAALFEEGGRVSMKFDDTGALTGKPYIAVRLERTHLLDDLVDAFGGRILPKRKEWRAHDEEAIKFANEIRHFVPWSYLRLGAFLDGMREVQAQKSRKRFSAGVGAIRSMPITPKQRKRRQEIARRLEEGLPAKRLPRSFVQSGNFNTR